VDFSDIKITKENRVPFIYRYLTLIYVLLLVTLPVGICQASEGIVTVKADGYDTIKNGNMSDARGGAIQSAFSRALEDVVATMISDEKIKQNYSLLDEKVYSRAQTFIQNYSVVKEKTTGNMYQLSIRADIAAKRLKSMLAEEGLYHLESKMPEVLLITAKQDGSTGELLLSLPEEENNEGEYTFEALFLKYLEEAGFRVIKLSDKVDFDSNIYSADDLLSDEVMKEVGADYNADLVSFVRLLDNSSIYGGEGSLPGSASVLITAKVVEVKTGELVFSDMSKGIDFGSDGETALRRAVKSAATPLLGKMSDAMASKKVGIEESLSLVHMTVSGLKSYDDLIKFQKAMEEKVGSIDSIEPRGFSSGKAALDVTIKGTTKNLSDALTMILDVGFNLDIVDYGADYILLNMKTHNPSE